MSTSPSYRKSDCCGGADCWFLDWDPDEPCWGKVEVEVSGDGDVFHACRGHRDTLNLSSLAPGLLEYYREPRCNPMLEVTKVVPCPECSGTGKIVMFSSVDPCPKCEGTGKVEVVEPWVIKGGG